MAIHWTGQKNMSDVPYKILLLVPQLARENLLRPVLARFPPVVLVKCPYLVVVGRF